MDPGNIAWILASTALVLLMTLPGLAMLYAGLVQSKSVLSVVMQCICITCVASLLWFVVGYSLSFGESQWWFIGGLDKAFLWGITAESERGTLPEIVFVIFQMTFAVIAPAVIVGAYTERMKFLSALIFSGVWSILVYAPICHWVWGGGWLAQLGIMDFAGGVVLHANVGITALVVARVIGPREGFPDRLLPPHNPVMTATGAGMLWVGWFGFNGGSQLAADGIAGMAIATTHIAAAAGGLTWIGIEWARRRPPSLIGTITGAIAGLAAVTPASGFIGPAGGLILGIASGALCSSVVDLIKQRLKIDDSLDVFAVHGLGGILGTILLPLLALEAMGGRGFIVEGRSVIMQMGIQGLGLLASVAWAALLTYLILKAVNFITRGSRVDLMDELAGLDLATHGERGYDLFQHIEQPYDFFEDSDERS